MSGMCPKRSPARQGGKAERGGTIVMTDGGLIPISDEQAKLGQEIVKTFRRLGSFLAKALGSTPEDLIGYFGGDSLRFRRAENMARMMHEAQERLEAMGITETKPATLSIALPILQNAADEDREELVDLWARLLASAMNPSASVRHSFIASVRAMDSMDAKLSHFIYSEKVMRIRFGGGGNKKIDQSVQSIASPSISLCDGLLTRGIGV